MGLLSNVGLCGVKGVAGVYSNSTALIADAFHSASDLSGDIVTLAALNLSQKPADDSHPYGYGHYESLGALAISGMLMSGGGLIGYHSLNQLFELAAESSAVSELTAVPAALAVIGLSVFAKEALYRYTLSVGKKTRSPVLVANAWHHRTDAFSSVVAGVGVVGAYHGMQYLDPAAGLLVAGMILKAGAEMSWSAVGNLTDRKKDSDALVIQGIYSIARDLANRPGSGIIDAHEVRLRHLGYYDLLDLHLSVSPRLSVTGGYIEKNNMKALIHERYPSIEEIFIHVQAHSSKTNAFTSANFDATMLSPSAVAAMRNGVSSTIGATKKKVRESKPVRTQFQIERDVVRAVDMAMKTEPRVLGLSHCVVHYDMESKEGPGPVIKVEVNLEMEKTMSIADAEEAATAVRQHILSIDDVQAADLHIELPDH